jgi:hypothetical protein
MPTLIPGLFLALMVGRFVPSKEYCNETAIRKTVADAP